jgi:hypothetical protein
MEPVTLELLAERLRHYAELLDGCAASGGDMTSMIEISDGHWLTAKDLNDAINGQVDSRFIEMARGEAPLTVHVEEDA